MKKLVKTMALVTAALMLVTGCGKKEVKEASDNKLTYWVEFGNQVSTGVNKMGELPQYKKMLEDLGLDVDFIHPVNGQVAEQLNLKIASGDLPDIIQYQFAESYPGGAAKALEDKVIIPLDLDRAPNLKKYLSEHPDIDRQVKLDDGTYYCFPNIYGDDYLLTYTGIIVRQDMLDKIGCQMPETIDEWTNVLTKAKNELGLRAPFTLALNSSSQSAYWLLSAFDLAPNYYVDNGKIKYAPNEDAMEEYEKIILLYNPLTYETADVINSYVYRKGIQEFNYSYSTAVGLFNSVVIIYLWYVLFFHCIYIIPQKRLQAYPFWVNLQPFF